MTSKPLSAPKIKELRLEESLPIINELGKWIFKEIKGTLPKSQIGKAMGYSYAGWDALSAYLYDSHEGHGYNFWKKNYF